MKSIHALILMLLTTSLNFPVQADRIFKWVDTNGTTHYSSKPPLPNIDTEIITSLDEPDESSENKLPVGVPSADSESTSQDPSQPDQNPEVLAYCKKLTEHLETLDSEDQVRLNKTDGSFEILGDEGRGRERDRIRQQMKKFCL
ncbi:DUF4124 domain-containing protein [Endozoicomonas numazuensis]|uniref:DUF4124 domain-containing protein n=1 Tax=Endozoicomonas numazuensis TaxID=1137799 RepID=A0A081NI85_9GAMM|nr:DUF4124 domain-containing protein [Endozoicomonas numazuensis]KEQ18158.1 hypothetical protein GZ78_11420 [Endozoicomonas numazuensis]